MRGKIIIYTYWCDADGCEVETEIMRGLYDNQEIMTQQDADRYMRRCQWSVTTYAVFCPEHRP